MRPIVVIGCLEETLDTLSFLDSLGTRVDALITLPADLGARSGLTNWVDLGPLAQGLGLPVHYVDGYSMKGDSDYELVGSLAPEVILVVGWQRLVPDRIIQLSKLGCIGFHGSANLLPWGRGRSPINWSIIEGRDRFILHMFFIAPGVDDGDIIGLEVYDIQPEDTCRSVYYKTAMAQARLIGRFLPKIRKGQCPSYPQLGEAYHYPKRTPEDGRIDWSWPGERICRLVRAVTRPYPGAFTFLSRQKVCVWSCQYFGDNLLTSHGRPGEAVFVSSNELREVVVQTGKGAVVLTNYQSPAEIKPGDVLDG